MTALQRAIDICGSQRRLAELIGVTQGRVSQWLKGELIPVRFWPRIVAASGGQVTPSQLLDDEFAKLEAMQQAEAV